MNARFALMASTLALFFSALSSFANTSEREIYRCTNKWSLDENPAQIKSITLTVIENGKFIANRPEIYAHATAVLDDGKVETFDLALIGIPELLATGYHAYFLGKEGFETKELSLLSGLSMSGAKNAWLNIKWNSFSRNAVSFLRDVSMSCEVLAENIYTSRH